MGLHRGEDSTLSRVEEVLVNDGDWHHLQLDISSLGGASSHHKAVLSLDQGLYLVSCFTPVNVNHHELNSCSFAALKSASCIFSGQYGGGREAARLQAEDCERWWFCKA